MERAAAPPSPVEAALLSWSEQADRVAQALQRTQEQFAALADSAPVAVLCADAGTHVVRVNARLGEVYGLPLHRLTGRGWLAAVHGEDRDGLLDAVAAVGAGAPRELPVRVVRADGQVRLVHVRLVPVRAGGGFVGTLHDVTDQHANETTLAHQASHDPLTGLLNRRGLLLRLGDELQASQAGPGRTGPALLYLDLDDFKVVNDALGHEAGDRLLVDVSHRLREAVREGDVVSRFGGDEFAVLCRGLDDETAAVEVARRLLQAVTGEVVLEAAAVPLSASMGVVVAGPQHVQAEDVLRDADVAMYQAKAAGKGGWAVFEEQLRERVQARLEMARDLRRALDDGALSVHYQPVVSLDGAARVPLLVSVEALARWTHDVHGPVSPAEFVAVAEENGLVGQLGLQVLRAACAQMVRWRTALGGRAPRSVSVNVSAVQLRQADFPDVVERVLRETGLDGGALCLELTETVVLHDAAAAAACFGRLRGLGVRIAIDDFGTGYSSLSVLRRMPFDTLKIDRSLLAELRRYSHDPVVAAVIALGRAMDLAVIAEGVETTAQATELRRLGCPLAQGFLFGRPMPPAQLEDWVRDRAG